MHCKQCGNPVAADALFCPHCGKDILAKTPKLTDRNPSTRASSLLLHAAKKGTTKARSWFLDFWSDTESWQRPSELSIFSAVGIVLPIWLCVAFGELDLFTGIAALGIWLLFQCFLCLPATFFLLCSLFLGLLGGICWLLERIVLLVSMIFRLK